MFKILGTVVGGCAYLIGGVGVAAMGTAIGIPAVVVGAAGAAVGYAIGSAVDGDDDKKKK